MTDDEIRLLMKAPLVVARALGNYGPRDIRPENPAYRLTAASWGWTPNIGWCLASVWRTPEDWLSSTAIAIGYVRELISIE